MAGADINIAREVTEDGRMPTEDEVNVMREVDDEFERTDNQDSHAVIQVQENSVASTSKMITAMAANKSPRIGKEQVKSSSPKRLSTLSPSKKAQTLKQPQLR